jgi:hypothetical protein
MGTGYHTSLQCSYEHVYERTHIYTHTNIYIPNAFLSKIMFATTIMLSFGFRIKTYNSLAYMPLLTPYEVASMQHCFAGIFTDYILAENKHHIYIVMYRPIARQPRGKHSFSKVRQKRYFLCGLCGVYIRKACS